MVNISNYILKTKGQRGRHVSLEKTNDEIRRVYAGDWKGDGLNLFYRGKYAVGNFKMGESFMLDYMRLFHNQHVSIGNIPNSTQNFATSEDAIMNMEYYGIIDNRILIDMREMVKVPKYGYVVTRCNNVIISIYKEVFNGPK